jgi:hypothetical protein
LLTALAAHSFPQQRYQKYLNEQNSAPDGESEKHFLRWETFDLVHVCLRKHLSDHSQGDKDKDLDQESGA